jgi:anti-anti-sigma regulatory factor
MTTRKMWLAQGVFGMAEASTASELVLDVREAIGSEDALEPALGEAMAARAIGAWASGRVLLDFSRVSVVSSAFANAFFAAIATARPLDDLRGSIDFVGLRPRLLQVWTRSFKAVRNTLAESTSPPSR